MHFDFFAVTQHTKVKMMVIGWNCIGGTALCASNKTHLCSTIITGEAAHTTRKILQVHHQEIKYRNSNLSKCEMLIIFFTFAFASAHCRDTISFYHTLRRSDEVLLEGQSILAGLLSFLFELGKIGNFGHPA